MPGRKSRNSYINTRVGLSALLRRPSMQLAMVAFVAFIIYLIALSGGETRAKLPGEVTVEDAYQMVQKGSFMLDVRTQAEWDEYHAPNATLIPLDQLQIRLDQVPKDRQILVVGNRSQEARDILLAAGYNAASMAGGMKDWYAKGYPIEGAPPQ